MPHVFISYAKKDTRRLAETIFESLQTIPNVTAWMDTSLEADESWALQIQQEIDRADYVIVLLSPDVNRPVTGKQRRSFVLNEIDYAQQDNKPILPILVLQTKMPVQLAGIQYIDLRTAPDNPEPIVKRVCERFGLEWTTRPEQSVIQVKTGWSQGLLTRRAMIGLGAMVLFLIIGAVALSSFNGAGTPNPAIAGVTTPDLTGTLDAMVTSILGTNIANETATAAAFTPTPTPTDTPTATDTPDMAQTLVAQNTEAAVIAANFLATQQSQLTANAPTNTPQPTATSTETPTATPTATDTPTITPTATLDLPATAAAATRVQQEALATVNAQATRAAQATVSVEALPTLEIRGTQVVTVTMVRITSSANANVRSGPGQNFGIVTNAVTDSIYELLEERDGWYRISADGWVSSQVARLEQSASTNVDFDWTPVERDFDGVTTVLVPAGCFMMGSENGNGDEEPVHEQCFDEPFWIDKYEVTQADFTRLGGQKANPNSFPGDQRPVESITWFESRDFCELRGMRLPTEAEWEYVARGPDSLVYPWGNNFVAENVMYYDQTAVVGSRPAGASWVGALEMSGNVYEWVLSEYRNYPYDAEDGREDTGSDTRRVMRGGSWHGGDDDVRATSRLSVDPSLTGSLVGFRCVRS